MRVFPALMALAAWICVSAVAVGAAARPQFNAAVLPGLGVALDGGSAPIRFHGALAADVMLGRDSPRSWGLGPAFQVATAGFDDVRLHLGGSVQLPFDALQLVVSPLPYYRFADKAEFGLGARVFLGLRSYNYTADYGSAFGLEAGLDWGVGSARERQVVVGARLDGMWLAMPFLALVSWLRCCDE